MAKKSDPFSRHGIDHLSPSSLNLYAEQPAMWALKYLHNFDEGGNARMWRGSAVEAGVDHWLYRRDADAATTAALAFFEHEAVGEITDELDKERANIPSMLDQAITMLHNRPEPTGRQFKVEYWIDDIEIPVIGF